ncbi:MAG: molybdopterin molybdotransferase MoeA [Burkholderiales bacterium]|nr:molybdopterin molybdotransferase MoeA [Burkholderiales bacterium]
MVSDCLLNTLANAEDYDPHSMAVEKARDFIHRTLGPVCGVECVPLKEAIGRTLALDILAPLNVPGYDNSAMDGYALRFSDVIADGETCLKRIGESFAGRPFCGMVGIGECVRIFTGAIMPDGADTVVMQEKTEEMNGVVCIAANSVAAAGQNRRFAGEDIVRGEIVFTRGQRIGAPELGILASLGIAEIFVYRRLRVAFFSTGDELTPLGAPLAAGQIYDSNRYSLYGMLRQLEVTPIDLGAVPDTPDALDRMLTDAAQNADVVISIGGVSVGDADFVKEVLKKRGKILSWKLAMKPGKPLAYGVLGNAHFFGLPGNPVSAMVTFYQFVREALLILQGQIVPSPTLWRATLTASVKKSAGRTEFQRGVCENRGGQMVVTPAPEQGSGILSSMTRANCFIVLQRETGKLSAGETVDIQMFTGLVE